MVCRGQHAVGEAGAHGGAGREQAERRAFGNFLRELHGLRAHVILRHADIGQPHSRGFLSGHAAAGVENQFRIVLADQFGKGRGQTKTRVKSELGEIGGKPRLRTGDAKIRRHRQTQSTANGGAVNRSHDRLLVAENPHRLNI